MTRHAVVIFGKFPTAPLAIRQASAQSTFAYGHAMVAISGAAKPTAPFVDEYSGEDDVIAGVKRYTDCVYASLDMALCEMTHGRIVASSAMREHLQELAGADPTPADPGKGSNALDAAKAAAAVGVTIAATNAGTWADIRDALGGDAATCQVGEPMAKARDYQPIRVGDLQPFCASLSFMHATVTEVAEEDVMTIAVPVGGLLQLTFHGGTITGYKPDGTHRQFTVKAGDKATGCSLQIDQSPQKAPNGLFRYVIDGPLAGWAVLRTTVDVAAAQGDCSAIQAQLDSATAQVKSLSTDLAAAQRRIAAAKTALG